MPQPAPLAPHLAPPWVSPLEALRARIARLESAGRAPCHGPHPFGHTAIDAALPGGGLARGALHEAAGRGVALEHGTAAALFIAGCMARLGGPVLWAMERCDLFAPGLAMAGLAPDRLLYAEAGRAEEVLRAMEEGLREPALVGVVGEVTGRLSLSATRRLHLAAERTGALAFLLRRSRKPDDPALEEPSAANTRWRISAQPSGPPLPRRPGLPGLAPRGEVPGLAPRREVPGLAPRGEVPGLAPRGEVPGLARARWRLELVRARGAEPGEWMVEACDATGHLGVVADFSDRSAGPIPAAAPVAELEYEYEPEPEYAPALSQPRGRRRA